MGGITVATNPSGEGSKPQDPQGGEAVKAQDPQAAPVADDATKAEGSKPQDAAVAEDKAQETEPKPKVDHKLEADLRRAKMTVKELQAQLAERETAGKTTEQRVAELEQRLAEAETKAETEKANAALTAAGCVDLELGRTALKAYETVDALKDAKPYLFAAPKTERTTGGKAVGAASGGVARTIREGLN